MNIETIIEAVLFASGEPVPIERFCMLLDKSENEIIGAAKKLADEYVFYQRGIRIVRLENSLQMCSAPEYYDYIRRALETRKPPKLSAASIEVLSIVAYYQPITRTYIEQIRGVDSSYTVGVLADRGLIEPCGRLDVPGRPVIYRTTEEFLRVFGLSSLDELPKLSEEIDEEIINGQLDIESAIENLKMMETNTD
ncbi:MAG: SMC-Scp complex subunit ScpB [Clostridiales bacterium]|nr:SMC-Scp complex subunit ScpB [Clostridiales bacterium]